MTSNAEKVSIWWRHHEVLFLTLDQIQLESFLSADLRCYVHQPTPHPTPSGPVHIYIQFPPFTEIYAGFLQEYMYHLDYPK